MPEYLAPGVFVEEVSFRSKSIEGVSTTTTAFIGPTRYGPVDIEPDIVTSLSEYEWTYGGADQLVYGSAKVHNHMWHAVRAFFENGGKRLYVSRAYSAPAAGTGRAAAHLPASVATPEDADGTLDGDLTLYVQARVPGAAGQGTLLISPVIGGSAVSGTDASGKPAAGAALTAVRYTGLSDGDRVLVVHGYVAATLADPAVPASVALASVAVSDAGAVTLTKVADVRERGALPAAATDLQGLYPVRLNLTWRSPAGDPNRSWEGVRPADVADYFSVTPPTIGLQRSLPIVVRVMTDEWVGETALAAVGALTDEEITAAILAKLQATAKPVSVALSGGSDGALPEASAYEGKPAPASRPSRTSRTSPSSRRPA